MANQEVRVVRLGVRKSLVKKPGGEREEREVDEETVVLKGMENMAGALLAMGGADVVGMFFSNTPGESPVVVYRQEDFEALGGAKLVRVGRGIGIRLWVPN